MITDKYRQSLCSCGLTKDKRAKQCWECSSKEPIEKSCSSCNITYPINLYPLRPNGRGGLKRRSKCKSCEAKEARERRAANPEKAKELKKTWYDNNPDKAKKHFFRGRFKKFGIDPIDGLKLLKEHSGHCDICGTKKQQLLLDHNHVTNEFRGFLCSNCNTALGKFKDSINLLKEAIQYLTLKGSYGPTCRKRLGIT